MRHVTFRFYEELNDFLRPEERKRPVEYVSGETVTAKDAIESIGVPHAEVDLITVNGRSVGFDHRLEDGDRVAVYPAFESIDVSPIARLRPRPLRRTAFVADVHLRRLARHLRLLGYDVAWSAAMKDRDLVACSLGEGRAILTRDRQVLKYREVTHGYWVRSDDPVVQAREVIRRFDLADTAAPFTRCLECNGLLRAVEKRAVLERIPPKTAAWLDEYRQCAGCGRLYWRGTHTDRLTALAASMLDTD